MIAGTRRRTLFAGVALILSVNVIALAGVAWNRSGEPESTVRLSERELRLPQGRLHSKENSGVKLHLMWRVYSATSTHENYYGQYSYGGAANWLDKHRLAALGFDVSQDISTTAHALRRQQTRDVVLVLELDGPAYRQSLAQAQKKAEDEEVLKTANPGNKEFERRAKQSKEHALREESENSRLFVVDAGLDAETLRAQYPDKAHYLITRGQVRSQVLTQDRQERLTGFIAAVSVSQINVPVHFQDVLKQAPAGSSNKPMHYEATVAFGKRLEPWLVGLSEKISPR